MSTITPIQFLQALYPEPVTPGQLVLWTKSRRRGHTCSHWTLNLDEAARRGMRLRKSQDVYFGVALQDQKKAIAIARQRRPRASKTSSRGSEPSATLLPALWADLDIAGPGHRRNDLPPDRDAALGLLAAVSQQPSILVDTGGGYHAYWLLRRPLLLATEADRNAAKGLVGKLQNALRSAAAERGWWVDPTANLAQVMRLPETVNHKTTPGRKVTVEQFPLPHRLDESRYRRRDFDDLPAPPAGYDSACELLHDLEQGAAAPSLAAGPPAEFRPVYEGCSWIRHCYTDRVRLPEPEWFAVLTIVGRCREGGADGRRLAHSISRDHSGYTVAGTDAKLDNAMRSPGPRTCRQIATQLGAHAEHCSHCPNAGRIKSPIVLGRRNLGRGRRPSLPVGQRGRDSAPGDGANPQPRPAGGEPSAAQRPEILINTDEHRVNDQVLAALIAGEPDLFQRAGLLVQVMRPDQPPGGRRAEAPLKPAIVKPVAEARLREIAARSCAFVKPGATGPRPAHPPRWAMRALLGRGTWPGLPVLEGVVESPVLRADGSVLQQPGYDAASGLLYLPGTDFEPVPESPSRRQLDTALTDLQQVVCDFPFRNEAHLSAWLSSMLTPLARPAFQGPSPLNLIDANVRGSGKSLLADVVSTLLTGSSAPRMSYSQDEDEIRKQITGLALQATRLVLIDNVSGVFGSPTLDRALTAETWRDRLLGGNEQVSVPLEVTWYATGNNIALRGDTPRRCLHIRLESPRQHPEHRTDFRHPRLLAWLLRQRRRLLPAALTLLRAYAAAGAPAQGLAGWGSFDGWSDRVRSTLVWLGLPDPADTREGLAAASSAEGAMLRDLVDGLGELLETLGGSAASRDILAALARRPDRFATLRTALAELGCGSEGDHLPTPSQLSAQLGALRGRFAGGACIEQGPRSYKGVCWQVRNHRAVSRAGADAPADAAHRRTARRAPPPFESPGAETSEEEADASS